MRASVAVLLASMTSACLGQPITPRAAKATAPSPCVITVSGRVVDAYTGVGVPSFTVTSGSLGPEHPAVRATTTDSGTYRLAITLDDTTSVFTLRAARIGYAALTTQVKRPTTGWDSVTTRFVVSPNVLGFDIPSASEIGQRRGSAEVTVRNAGKRCGR